MQRPNEKPLHPADPSRHNDLYLCLIQNGDLPKPEWFGEEFAKRVISGEIVPHDGIWIPNPYAPHGIDMGPSPLNSIAKGFALDTPPQTKPKKKSALWIFVKKIAFLVGFLSVGLMPLIVLATCVLASGMSLSEPIPNEWGATATLAQVVWVAIPFAVLLWRDAKREASRA